MTSELESRTARRRWERTAARRLLRAVVRPFTGSSRGAGYVEYILIFAIMGLGLSLAFQRFRLHSNVAVRNEAKTVMTFDAPDPLQALLGLGGYETYQEMLSCSGDGNLCMLPGTNCFAAGTPVSTENGDRPIEDIRVGERVWSRDPTTGAVELHRVKNTWFKPAAYVIDLQLGTNLLHSETVTVTPNHPFWVEGRGWTQADALTSSEMLWSPVENLTATALATHRDAIPVYNLEVEGAHTYLVGHSHALVHNQDIPTCPGPGGGGSNPPAKTAAEIKQCADDYLAAHPYSQYQKDRAGLEAECATKNFEPATGGLRDPNAGSYPPPAVTAEDKPGCAPKYIPPSSNANNVAQQRTEELCKGTKEGKQNGIDLSESGGDQAAKDYANQNFPASAGWQSYPGSGANVFDLVMVNKNTGEVVILEAKGGNSTLGDRWAKGGSASNTRVQQGTKEYIEAVTEALKKSNPSLAKKIEDQLDTDNLRYLLVRQPFDGDCGPPPKGTAGQVEVSEFNLNNGNTACP